MEELTDRRTEDCRLGTTEHVAGDKPLRSHFSEGRSRVVTALNALDEQHAFDTETREAMAAALGEAVKTSKFGDDPQRVTEILLEALDGSRDW
ncbi:hypothetical protein [Rhodococcus sp. APC 3903]|uniref:hypothetical protein n=1 Tax=Rhodococcus sp. APC 3903 TaxID=3035193 RepID=UPI0025B2DA63|nr:hypothetical protein [Rhodococcus sp. APC 3903]MDN3460955.1 hypothetical protein [Rhodococcus sp. APC 3903]